MAMTKNLGSELAKLEREREAIRVAAAALDAREKLLKQAQAEEGAKHIAQAFSGLDLGDVNKAQAKQFAKAVKHLGFIQALARLTAA